MPRAPRTKAPAVDAGALVGGARARPADPLGPGEVLQLQRSAGNAAVARLLVTQRSPVAIQRNEKSAALLTHLAKPRVGEGQAIEVQTKLVEQLDKLVAQTWSKEDDRPAELNLGGILIDHLPKADSYMPTGGDKPENKQQRRKDVQVFYEQLAGDVGEGSATPAVQFVGLDTDVKGARAPGPVKFGGQVKKEAGLGSKLVENTLKTVLDAEQFEYLRLAGLPNKEWKILVELHYIRARPKDMAGFHKDTQGQSLFVNLNYHVPGKQVRGPEYVVNPPSSEAHDKQIYGTAETQGTLPKEFTEDLTKTREALPEPTWIESAGTVEELGYVAFVDEAVHHATPWFGGRYVTPTEFKAYLERNDPAKLKEITKADADYRARSWGYTLASFSGYVNTSIIGAGEAEKWRKWLAMISVDETESQKRNRETKYTREDFKATMPGTEFDLMLADVGSQKGAARHKAGAGGWYAASIPGAGNSPVTPQNKPPLERAASKANLTKDWPAQLAEDVPRKFIRSWVRAVPKSFADSVRNS